MMMELLAALVSARSTTLSVAWLGTVVCSGVFLLTALLALFFRSRRLWEIAIALITVDLMLALSSAWLDHLGFH